MSSELQRAVLHGQAAAVQALLLAPLIEGTVEELERKQASRVEPEARLRVQPSRSPVSEPSVAVPRNLRIKNPV